MKFRHLILKKIAATRCQTFRLKCTTFNFGWAMPQTPLGELTAFLRSQLDLRGLRLRKGMGMGEEWDGVVGKGRKERGREGKKKEKER